ncbi:hypothetical protein JCM10213v2_009238 [Rhodosporidiobolus nylandii]
MRGVRHEDGPALLGLWPTHKVLCGRDPDYFFLPPLSEAELADFRLAKDHPYSEGKTFLEMHQQEPFGRVPDWEAVEALVTATTGVGTRGSLADMVIYSAREHLNMHYRSRGDSPPLSITSSPWQLFVYQCTPALSHAVRDSPGSFPLRSDPSICLNAYFRALLCFSTLAVADATSHRRTGRRVASFDILDRSYLQVILSIDKCAVDEAMKAVLRRDMSSVLEGLRKRAASRDEQEEGKARSSE